MSLSKKNVRSVDYFKKKRKTNMEENKLTIQEEWLLIKKISVKYSSYCKYDIINKHLNIFLKDNPIEELTEMKIIHYIDYLINIMNLSTSMINSIRCVLKSICKYGEQTHQLKHLDFDLIKFSQKTKTKDPLNKENEIKLWDYCIRHKNKLSLAISLGLYAGLRIGEICALKWEDIDLEHGTININKTVQRLKSDDNSKKTHLYVLEPKSNSSIRNIVIADFLVVYLKEHYDLFEKQDENFILSNRQITIDPRTIQRAFTKLCENKEIDATFHTLRHTFATNCIKKGIDIKTVSETLGHANVNITLNRYVHTSFDFKKEQINKMQAPI